MTDLAPTVLIIGAAKSGTTSLHHYLSGHPQVFTGPVKEPRFFAFEGRDPDALADARPPFVTEWEDYLRLFAGARPDQARGEASIAYLHGSGVVDRVRRRVPDAALVAILRHPAEAAWSWYLMARRNGRITVPFEVMIDREPAAPATDPAAGTGRTSHMLRSRHYHWHLQRWLAVVPREQLLVVLHEDLRDDPAALLRRVCAHIGVDPDAPLELGTRQNVGTDPRSGRLYRLMNRPGPTLQAVQRVGRRVPGVRAARSAVDLWNRRPVPAMPAGARARLLERFRDDTLALEDLLGRDLGAWRR